MNYRAKQGYNPDPATKPRNLTEEEIQVILDAIPPPRIRDKVTKEYYLMDQRNFFRQSLKYTKLTPAGINIYNEQMKNTHEFSEIAAHSSCGNTAAETLGSSATQNTMNSFKVGSSQKTISVGVKAMEELIKVSRNRSFESARLFFHDETMTLREVLDKRQYMISPSISTGNLLINNKLKDFVIYERDNLPIYWWHDLYENINGKIPDSESVLRLQFDPSKLYIYKISLDYIAKKIANNVNLKSVVIIHSPTSDGILDIFPSDSVSTITNIDDRLLTEKKFLGDIAIPILQTISIKGIPGITEFYPVREPIWQVVLNEKQDVEDRLIWYIFFNTYIAKTKNITINNITSLLSSLIPTYEILANKQIIKLDKKIGETNVNEIENYRQFVHDMNVEIKKVSASLIYLTLYQEIVNNILSKLPSFSDGTKSVNPYDKTGTKGKKSGISCTIRKQIKNELNALLEEKDIVNVYVDILNIATDNIDIEINPEDDEEYVYIIFSTIRKYVNKHINIMINTNQKLTADMNEKKDKIKEYDDMVNLRNTINNNLDLIRDRDIEILEYDDFSMSIRMPFDMAPTKLVREVDTWDIRDIHEYDDNYKSEDKKIQREPLAFTMRKDFYVADVAGRNLESLLAHPIVNPNLSFSNNMYDIYRVFGIEAVRTYFIKEYTDNLTNNGDYIDPRNIKLTADHITLRGIPQGISFHTYYKHGNATIASASFQHTEKVITNASFVGKKETSAGVSSSIVVGNLIPVGTGKVKVIAPVDPIKISNSNVNDALDSLFVKDPLPTTSRASYLVEKINTESETESVTYERLPPGTVQQPTNELPMGLTDNIDPRLMTALKSIKITPVCTLDKQDIETASISVAKLPSDNVGVNLPRKSRFTGIKRNVDRNVKFGYGISQKHKLKYIPELPPVTDLELYTTVHGAGEWEVPPADINSIIKYKNFYV